MRPARRGVLLPAGLGGSLEGDKDSVTAVGFKRVGQAGKVVGLARAAVEFARFERGGLGPVPLAAAQVPPLEQADAGQESCLALGFQKKLAGLGQNTLFGEHAAE